jgi:hypothetical protein
LAPETRRKRRGDGAPAPGVSSSPTPPEPPKAEPPRLLSLREIDALPDATERRRAMLDRIEDIKTMARGRSWTNKRGDTVDHPDTATMLRAEELALSVLDVQAASPQRRPVDLSVFNGGKAAEKKAAG